MLTHGGGGVYYGDMTKRPTYTVDSIERALDSHQRAGRIKDWRRHNSQYLIGLNRADDLLLKNHREAWIFVAGLASAGFAPIPQETAP